MTEQRHSVFINIKQISYWFSHCLPVTETTVTLLTHAAKKHTANFIKTRDEWLPQSP